MNKVRKKQIVELVNYITETLNKGSHRTVCREIISEAVRTIQELLAEVEELEKK